MPKASECTVHDRSFLKTALKALNSTQWSGRYDAVYALKEIFCDVTKCLTAIILTSKNSKERDEPMTKKKQIENFNFVFMLVVRCKILQIVNIFFESYKV